MSKMKSIIFLFVLLVVTIASGVYFTNFSEAFTNFSKAFTNFSEAFTSSSEKNRGQGIGDSYAAPLDLPLNTDNTRFFGLSQIPTNM